MSENRIRILIVDDSAFMRRMIQNILEQEPEFEVVGSAKDGLDALKKAQELNPDVITLDVEMPVMDGLTSLEHLSKQDAYGVIMISSHTQEGTASTIRALELGAFDFVSKPANIFNMPAVEKKSELILKVKQAYKSKQKCRVIGKSKPEPIPATAADGKKPKDLKYLIAIGISTGGPKALSSIIPLFPADLPAAVIIVQHMPPGFTKSLAKRLDECSRLTVKEAEHMDELKPGYVYVAPGDFHLNVKCEGNKTWLVLSDLPPQGGFRPSVDNMMNSVADSCLTNIIGIIMTGMGSDGSKGLKELKDKKKAYIIAQDERTSVVFGMPKAAIESGIVDEIVPLMEIPNRILNYMGVRQ
jgi:two-component system chemotaxis response regulator CheB